MKNMRQSRIGQIRRWVARAREAGNKIDKEKLIIVVMKKFFVSRRTAKEYLETI